eukprot:gene335-558_t
MNSKAKKKQKVGVSLVRAAVRRFIVRSTATQQLPVQIVVSGHIRMRELM